MSSAGSPVRPVTGSWSRRVTELVHNTDWSARTVVDVVSFAPATSRGFEDDRPRTEVYRYDETPPPPTTYENGERPYRVERVTRPLYERLADDW